MNIKSKILIYDVFYITSSSGVKGDVCNKVQDFSFQSFSENLLPSCEEVKISRSIKDRGTSLFGLFSLLN